MTAKSLPFATFEYKRDAYGFAVRPQHLQRYREYAKIYKEEEEERSELWKNFLERVVDSAETPSNDLLAEVSGIKSKDSEEDSDESQLGKCNGTEQIGSDSLASEPLEKKVSEPLEEETSEPLEKEASEPLEEETSEPLGKETSPAAGSEDIGLEPADKETSANKILLWADVRTRLGPIEQMMSYRVKKRKALSSSVEIGRKSGKNLAPIEEGSLEEDSEEEFYDVERSDSIQEIPPNDGGNSDSTVDTSSQEPIFPWKVELESLVRGGVPMALRGELWQAFVGVRTRRVEGYYHNLLNPEAQTGDSKEADASLLNDNGNPPKRPEKWKGQIEKDLPRTFPGHPALDEDGRNALRRILTAYARHNPSVGYCQAMNFFAGLLLLLMPEENAFWSLMGIIDDSFDGYYSEEMIESQVDQLVFEDLVHERFPKLVNHLDFLGVEVAWVTGPWFLSIFINMLPWESVLRVWDVLLFDGNRVMLFRTALALMELYGPALVTTKDAGDAVTLLQSLAGSTFDSSQLVLTACMGYQAVNEIRLIELRKKRRPEIIAAMEERSKGLRGGDSKGLASKLYSFKHDQGSLLPETNSKGGSGDLRTNGDLHLMEPGSTNLEGYLDAEFDSVPDLKEQVTWLKVELCSLLEEKRSAVMRAEELETALMEMVKQDNRRILTVKVEQLEQEVSELRQALSDKQEQERAMLEVLMRMEQEQKVTEDARVSAEHAAAAQKYAAHVLQEKYEEATILLSQMEKRAVMAETMLEATLQYQSGQLKAHQSVPASPRTPQADARNSQESQDAPTRKVGLLSRPFGLGWRDRHKGKASSAGDLPDGNVLNDGGENLTTPKKDATDHPSSG